MAFDVIKQAHVMPAADFYEWPVHPDGTKQPDYIQPAGDDEVFSIAALWDRSRTESGEDVLSCAIITMPANELLTKFTTRRSECRLSCLLRP